MTYLLIDTLISYLEMAMNGPLDNETRDNLVRSHAASKVGKTNRSKHEEANASLIYQTESPVYYQRLAGTPRDGVIQRSPRGAYLHLF